MPKKHIVIAENKMTQGKYARTKEHKELQSIKHLGQKAWNKGITYSQGANKKIEGKCTLCGTRIERIILRKDATCFTCKVLAARIKSNKQNEKKRS